MGDERRVALIVRRALEEPLKFISYNAGLEGGVVVEKSGARPRRGGLNAANGEYGDHVPDGASRCRQGDPVALRTRPRSRLFLTTEAIVAEQAREGIGHAAMPGGGTGF